MKRFDSRELDTDVKLRKEIDCSVKIDGFKARTRGINGRQTRIDVVAEKMANDVH